MCTVINYDFFFLVVSKYCPGSDWHLGPPKTVHVEEQNSLNLPNKVLKATQLGCTLHDVPHDDMCMPGEWVVGIAVDRDVLYLTSPMMTCTPGKWVVGIAIDRDVLTWCSPWWLVQTRWVDCGDSCRQERTLPYVPHDMYMPGEGVVGIAVDRDVLYLLSPMTCACQVSGLWG